MKMISKVELHLATIIKKKENYGLNEVTLQLDEVMSCIKHLFLKITQEKRKRGNAQVNSGKKRLGRLPLSLTRGSIECRLQEHNTVLYSGEATPYIGDDLKAYPRETGRDFFVNLHLVKGVKAGINAKLSSNALLDEVSITIHRKSLTNSKEKQKNERSLQKRIKSFALWILLLIQTSLVSAEDKGVLGEVFPIIEDDLLEVIQNKLGALEKDGTLKSHQQQIQQQIEKGIKRPVPVKNLKTTQTAGQTLFDPSIIVPYDLKDHQGRVFQKAGTKVNPLTMRSLSKPLLFIDGDDQAQIEWALSEHKANRSVKIILTSGAPLELSEKYNLPFYFDQDGVLTTKLGIKEVPSRVSQQDLYLSVESIPVTTDLGKDK